MTEIGSCTSLASQRIQEYAKIRVNECEYTKNWKNVFADVCIFYVPPPSLGIVSVSRNRRNICDYQLLIFTDSNFCIEKKNKMVYHTYESPISLFF